MFLPIMSRFRCYWPGVAISLAIFAQTAAAQEQERSLRDRIERPNMSMTAQGFEKTFTPSAGGLNKTASVRSFGFGRAATTKGDGAFRTKGYASNGYQTSDFSTKKSPLTDRGVAESERAYGTKAMPVSEDRAVGKTANTRAAQTTDRPFISHGKRQDEIDELRRQKQLSIDQVREILNKNK